MEQVRCRQLGANGRLSTAWQSPGAVPDHRVGLCPCVSVMLIYYGQVSQTGSGANASRPVPSMASAKSIPSIFQILLLLRRRRPSQRLVPVRISSKPLDDDLVLSLKLQLALAALGHLLPLLRQERPARTLVALGPAEARLLARAADIGPHGLDLRHGQLVRRDVLAVHQRQAEPHAVADAVPDLRVLRDARVDGARGDGPREGVEDAEHDGGRGPAVRVARDLVEEQHQGQPVQRRRGLHGVQECGPVDPGGLQPLEGAAESRAGMLVSRRLNGVTGVFGRGEAGGLLTRRPCQTRHSA